MLAEPHPSAGGDMAASLIVWVIAFGILFGAFVIAAGSSRERRSHFWLRALSVPLAPTFLTLALVAAGELGLLPAWAVETTLMLLVFLVIPVLMFVPVLLYRRPGPSDEDEGGGPGPDPPPDPPTPPRGGVPLLDADQARTRVRDHDRPVFGRSRPRRPTREPARGPSRTPTRTRH